MRRAILPLLIGATILMGCGSKKAQTTAEVEGMSFDSVRVDTVCHLTSDTASPAMTIRLSLQYAKGKGAQAFNDSLLASGMLMPGFLPTTDKATTFPEIVDSFVIKVLKDYKEFHLPLYRDDPEHSWSLNNSYEVRTETRNAYDDIINYIAYLYYYGGGAHGMSHTIVKNMNVKTGSMVTLNQLFVPGYETTLVDKLADKLMKHLEVETREEMYDMIFADQLYVPNNFLIEKDKITFIYGSDEIAAHAVGQIDLEIAKDELTDILKK